MFFSKLHRRLIWKTDHETLQRILSAGGCFHTWQKSMELCASSAKAQVYPVWLFWARGWHIPGQGMAPTMALLSHSTATGGWVNTDLDCVLLLHCILQRVSCCNRLFKTLAKRLAKAKPEQHACGNTVPDGSPWPCSKVGTQVTHTCQSPAAAGVTRSPPYP